MTFEKWIIGEMDRGLSHLEVDQMRAAWNAAIDACLKATSEPMDQCSMWEWMKSLKSNA